MSEPQPAAPRDVPFVHFSTANLAAGEAYAVWRETVSAIFEPTLDTDAEEPFRAEVGMFHLGDLLFSNTSVTRQRFTRTPRMIRRDGMDHFLIQVYCKGGYRGDVDGDSIDLRPGEVSILDLAKPLATRADSSDTLSLVVPRCRLDSLLAADRLHGRVLRGRQASLFSDYVFSLQRRLPSLLQEETASVIQVLTGLFAALARPAIAATMPTVQQELALMRARHHIENHLHRPQLGTEEIRLAAAISRASLYRLFEPCGGVARYLLTRRLARSRNALENPHDRRLIAEIAYAHGFVSEAHFSRTFRHEYGLTPRDVRQRQHRRSATTAPATAARPQTPDEGFNDWLRRFQRGAMPGRPQT